MLEWSEIKIAQAQRDYLVDQAAASRRQVDGHEARNGFQRAGNWVGGWLISLGIRLQSSSADVAQSLRAVQSSPVSSVINQAEQNC